MVGLEEAVSKARSFLVSQAGLGPLFLYLEEVGREKERWSVRFRKEGLRGEVIGRYVVEVDDAEGKVVGFKEFREREEKAVG
jgi:hypothetical protein